MVTFQFSKENQNNVNSKLLPKQCQNKFAVVSGATIFDVVEDSYPKPVTCVAITLSL
jgi:hypothetical protein